MHQCNTSTTACLYIIIFYQNNNMVENKNIGLFYASRYDRDFVLALCCGSERRVATYKQAQVFTSPPSPAPQKTANSLAFFLAFGISFLFNKFMQVVPVVRLPLLKGSKQPRYLLNPSVQVTTGAWLHYFITGKEQNGSHLNLIPPFLDQPAEGNQTNSVKERHATTCLQTKSLSISQNYTEQAASALLAFLYT